MQAFDPYGLIPSLSPTLMKQFNVFIESALAGILLCIFILAAPARGSRQDLPGVTVDPEGHLACHGQPVRAIGVNYFSAFLRTLKESHDRSYDKGFQTLAEYGIPFARFAASGFWPIDMRLYQENPEQYFRQLDAVVASAERHGVGLIASLFWHSALVPDLVGEPCDQWGNRASKTHQFMHDYVRQLVPRYVDSPAIWGWEFGNEYNLRADLPNAPSHRPPIAPHWGTPAFRSARDDLTSDMVRIALVEFARTVRQYDPYRFITSGHSHLRPAAWHMKTERSWTVDSPVQQLEILASQHPDPINVISLHAYGKDVARLEWAAKAARKLGKPLLVGEFGVIGVESPTARQQFLDLLDQVERSGAPLAAVWVFDLPAHEQKRGNISGHNARADIVCKPSPRQTPGLKSELSDAMPIFHR